jgi:thioredoxin reductase
VKGYRAAVIGAGPAGLAAALTLARSMQPTVVFDDGGPPRNAASPGVGSLLGRDKILPADLKRAGVEEIERYGHVEFVRRNVMRIEALPSGDIAITDDSGEVTEAATALLACGMVDELPPFDGIERFWGKSVINCPFCHGIELANRTWSVFVNRKEMLDVAEIYRMWTDDLTLIVDHGIKVKSKRENELAGKGIVLEFRRIRRLTGNGDELALIEFDDGTAMDYDALVVWPPQRHTDLVADLSLSLNDDGGVAVDDGYRTGVPGLYAAGDLLYAGHQNVNTALHMGNMAAAAMVLDLAKRGFVRAS